MKKSEKKFLKLPEYPGGKESYRKYIKENLVYPQKAIEQRIQGTVYLSAVIDGNGNVGNVIIENGLGAGCDEEAVRLINNIRFGGVKNKGVRIKTKKRFRIEFKLPAEKTLKYNLVKEKKVSTEKDNTKNYSYTINFNNN